MYLAPINYDRFFLRVFQDKFIAKSLLEDLLDVTIQEIEPMARKARLTDEAAFVEFDYRCKIDDNYVIVTIATFSIQIDIFLYNNVQWNESL